MKILNGLGITLVIFGVIVCAIKFYSFNPEPDFNIWYDPGLSFILLGIILLIPSLIRYIINTLNEKNR